MNIMTGYISATSGTVKIGGHDILEEPMEAKKMIGYLPEIPPLYEDMIVEEYLNFVCSLKGIKGKDNKKAAITEAEEAVKITDVKGRLIKNLSKGYKQRVGLAQALIGNPPLLILDEPTVGLDPNQIIEIRSLIKSLAGKHTLIKELGKNHTVILSSHILSEINATCDYVLIIDKGTQVAEDTPENLAEHFADKNRILLSVKGDREQVEEALKASSYLDSFEITQEQDGIVDVAAESASGKDVRDELFFEFADKKLAIVKMETENLSLEDVFLKLSGEDADILQTDETEKMIPDQTDENNREGEEK